jgi:hypothetical protein
MMQDCGPSMAMADPSCCKVHSSDTSMPPAQANRIEASTFAAHVFARTTHPIEQPDVAAFAHIAETPPGAAGPSHTSILRI